MKFLLLFGVLLVGGIGSYVFFAFSSYSWHQKMTIEVEADGKIYSGSSVVRVRWRKNDPLGAVNGPAWIKTVNGEAPYVEIPGRGVLFAILNRPGRFGYTENLAFQILGNDMQRLPVEAKFSSLQDGEGKTFILPKSLLPSFVAFTSIDDPKSVKSVEPGDFATSFGNGVTLRQVTLEITNGPITTGRVEQLLVWLPMVGGGMLDGQRLRRLDAKNTLANSLSASDFVRN